MVSPRSASSWSSSVRQLLQCEPAPLSRSPSNWKFPFQRPLSVIQISMATLLAPRRVTTSLRSDPSLTQFSSWRNLA